MIAILKNEFRLYFGSMTGYLFLVVFLAFSGLFFTANSLNIQSSDISNVFYKILGVLMYIIPLLTMKLFSEERKLKTFIGLKTLPLSVWQIVVGKFLAALLLMVIANVFTFSYVIVVAIFGRVAWPFVIGNYIAMLLLSAALISVGMLVSVFTENQIVAAVVTFGIFYISNFLGDMVTATSPKILVTIYSTFAIFSHHEDFTTGVFSVPSIVYYLSITMLMLVITTFALQTKRWD
jgi:ABC-2 type transport system permease protein